MEKLLKKNNVYLYFPVILASLFIGLLIYSSFSLDFPVDSLKEYKAAYKWILGIVTFFSLLHILILDSWGKALWHKKILLAGLAAFLISANYNVHYGIEFSLVFYGCCILFALKEWKLYRPESMAYFFIVYFLVQAVSLLWANNISQGLDMLQRYIPFVSLPVAFCFFRLSKAEINSILLVFFRAMMLFLFFSLCCWVLESRYLNIPLSEWLAIRKQPFMGYAVFDLVFAWSNHQHPTYNAIGYLFALAIGFYLYKKRINVNNINIIELVFVIITSFLLAIVTQSRFGLLGWFTVMFYGFARLIGKRKYWLALYFSGVALLGIVFIILFKEKVLDFVNDPIRIQNLDTAFACIKENGIWSGGTGLGGMVTVMNSQELAMALGYEQANVGLANPHHQFIGDLMQTGIWGLAVISILTAYLFYVAIKRRNWLLLVFISYFLIVMNTEMPLALSKGILYFTLFSCFLIQIKSRQNKKMIK